MAWPKLERVPLIHWIQSEAMRMRGDKHSQAVVEEYGWSRFMASCL